MTDFHLLPVTQHLRENPAAPVGFERAGKSVCERWKSDHPDCDGGQGLTEICKCRSEEWADRVVRAMNDLRALNSGNTIDENSEVHHAVALGEGAVCTKPYEFCVKTPNVEIRGIMTPVEYEYISEFVKRTVSMGGLKISAPEAKK